RRRRDPGADRHGCAAHPRRRLPGADRAVAARGGRGRRRRRGRRHGGPDGGRPGARDDGSRTMTTQTTAPTDGAERVERAETIVATTPARDTWNVLVRELRPVVRDPFTLIFSLV